MTPSLRHLWLAGAAALVVGVLVPGGGEVLSIPGILLLAAPAGVTASRQGSVGRLWRSVAWAVPVLPSLVTVGFVLYLLLDAVDGHVLAMVILLLGGLCVCVWVVFAIAFAVGRRR